MEWDLFECIQSEPKPKQPELLFECIQSEPPTPPKPNPPSTPKPEASTKAHPLPIKPSNRPGTIIINGRVQNILKDKPAVTALNHLPPEVLEHIFKYLNSKEIARAACTCRHLRDVSMSDCIWTEKIENEFGLKVDVYRSESQCGRKFYQNILYKYGWSLGCWIRQVKHYGGLLTVGVEDGMIVGKEVVPPQNPNFDQPVMYKEIFSIRLDADDNVRLSCLKEQYNYDGSAVRRRRRVFSACIEGNQSSEDDENGVEGTKRCGEKQEAGWDLFECIQSVPSETPEEGEEKKEGEEDTTKKPKKHGVEIVHVQEGYSRVGGKAGQPYFHFECLCPQTHKQAFDEFRQEDNTFRFLAMTKYDTLRSYGGRITYQMYAHPTDYVFSIPSNEAPDNGAKSVTVATAAPAFFPLKPGIFKGTYGGHGIEFVTIEKKSPYEYEAIKLSGDPNVPFGKISFCGDLRDFLFPTEEEQVSIDKLKPMEPQPQDDPAIYNTPQVYRTPPDCFIRSPFLLPDKCRGRFKAECQVSEWGYTAPQFINAHFIIFSQDVLALLILDIKSLVLFHRLTPEELGFQAPSAQIFQPMPVLTADEPAAAMETPKTSKPRRAVFRWPPPKFGEALGDLDQ